jgi:hypothetical protein
MTYDQGGASAAGLPDRMSPETGLDEFVLLRRANPAWRLLAADHAAVIVAFLDRAFLTSGARAIGEAKLSELLQDVLSDAAASGLVMPRPARDYLIDWCDDSCGWLRRYYAEHTDEPIYDLTAAAEAAVAWVKELRASRSFIGTQSRVLQVVELLNQIAEGTQTDPDERVRVLKERRDHIDQQIADLRSGKVEMLSAPEIRDRYQTLAALARGLLSDFRDVEENFRALDKETRERIALWDGPRGPLLDEVLGRRHFITEAETGASFTGLYDFLFDPQRWDRLQLLLRTVATNPQVTGIDDSLPEVTRDWLVAADQVQRTIARLSSQMRRFLEEQAYAENRRIGALVHSIEANAVTVRERQPTHPDFMHTDEPRADIALPMHRSLWEAPIEQRFADPRAAQPIRDDEIQAMEDLFAGQRVDSSKLRNALASILSLFPTGLTVKDATDLEPLTEGLAELVTVLEIATDAQWLADIDPRLSEEIVLDEPGRRRVATVPRMILEDLTGEFSHGDY